MAFYHNQHHGQPSNIGNTIHPPSSASSSHSHHGGRSRRAARLTGAANSHRHFRGVRSMKELAEAPTVSAYRARFDACRSFDLDDDLEFCPGLLTDDDLQSISSTSSDRSSLSSGSPTTSPLQHQVQPNQQVSPPFSLATTFHPGAYSQTHSSSSTPANNNSHHQMKLHQPAALRSRNAIPIVNPSTGMRVASPPLSLSPARMQGQSYTRRW